MSEFALCIAYRALYCEFCERLCGRELMDAATYALRMLLHMRYGCALYCEYCERLCGRELRDR